MKKICILIPVLEEEKYSKIYNKLNILKFKFDLLLLMTIQRIIHTKNIISKEKIKMLIFYLEIKGLVQLIKIIKWCYQRKYSTIITMDCDGTHDPKYIQIY